MLDIFLYMFNSFPLLSEQVDDVHNFVKFQSDELSNPFPTDKECTFPVNLFLSPLSYKTQLVDLQ